MKVFHLLIFSLLFFIFSAFKLFKGAPGNPNEPQLPNSNAERILTRLTIMENLVRRTRERIYALIAELEPEEQRRFIMLIRYQLERMLSQIRRNRNQTSNRRRNRKSNNGGNRNNRQNSN